MRNTENQFGRAVLVRLPEQKEDETYDWIPVRYFGAVVLRRMWERMCLPPYHFGLII